MDSQDNSYSDEALPLTDTDSSSQEIRKSRTAKILENRSARLAMIQRTLGGRHQPENAGIGSNGNPHLVEGNIKSTSFADKDLVNKPTSGDDSSSEVDAGGGSFMESSLSSLNMDRLRGQNEICGKPCQSSQVLTSLSIFLSSSLLWFVLISLFGARGCEACWIYVFSVNYLLVGLLSLSKPSYVETGQSLKEIAKMLLYTMVSGAVVGALYE